ncbi:MAG: YggS family pyridoxal phosphate-dependent enzyme [Magnetovibrio sp.]|nr:YggS family pyridoxal phosphate-dependent enzyme [Magnetovibrio sp.]
MMGASKNSIPDIQENLRSVKEQIAKVAKDTLHEHTEIKLVAVTKMQGSAQIREALLAGQKVFGENRVQEAEEKWPNLRNEFPGIQLRMIGPLQRNKVKRAVKLFDIIETIDRLELAEAVAQEMHNTNRRIDCFVQVNTGEEPQKAGVLPTNVNKIVEHCRGKLGLPLVGLMCIPPVDEEPGMHFGLLAEMARRNGLFEISMGMSRDYKTAIAFGATCVRVGTAIFGERQSVTGAGE